jgi:NTE family protein
MDSNTNGSTANGRLKVGLALGGGGARGFAHIGVLHALASNDIPIDVIAGTSIGAIIGCSYACGIPPKKLAALLDSLNLHELLGVPKNPLPEMVERVATEMLFQKAGWRNGDRDKTQQLFEFFKLMTRNRSFDELKIPFAAVACDVDTGEEIVMDQGKVYRALAASAALPGVHDPIRWDGRLLVDGGIIDKVPVKVAVALGADVVIAVDVSSALSETVNTTIEVIVQSGAITSRRLMQTQMELMQLKLGPRLITITPDVSNIKTLALHEVSRPAEVGRVATEAVVADIKHVLESETSVV